MSLRWQCVVVDCAEPEPVATFWAAALGWRRTHISADGGEIVPEALGATRAEVGQSARSDASWVVMTDVEANEFCVLRPYPV